MIFLVPMAGLGNKMRAIASGYRLAKKLNDRLEILWIDNHECNCPLDELFEIPSEIKVIHIPWIPIPLSVRMHLHDLIKAIYRRKCDLVLTDEEVKKDTDSLRRSLAGKTVFLETCYGWDCDTEDAFEIFRPTAEIRQRIKEEVEKLPAKEKLRGIHIRRTDHTAAIKASPREAFEDAIEEILRADTESCFYLASDDKEEKEYFINRFGSDHIFTKDFLLRRDRPEGIKGAVVELYLLGAGIEILGTKGSSYSDLASALTKTPLRSVETEGTKS